ncbi:MAG: hypothetical protein IJI45_00250 [Anaerolineaceae bacterium]|nr:hypothetical protein [Anaerolineaceae bacterium]
MTDGFENLELSDFSEVPPSGVVRTNPYGGGTEPVSDNQTGVPPTDPVSIWNRREPPQKDRGILTQIDLPDSYKLEPAVGWLVCIRGVDKGRSFRLVKGNNSIGRPGGGKNYAVELSDQQISRKGAAGVIVYNEKNNMFYITPGDLTTNINPYLNDEILLSPKVLPARSILEIADDVLMFVPFCCDKFVWRYTTEERPQRKPFYQDDRNAAAPEGRTELPVPPRKFENDPDGPTIVY